MKKIQVTIDQPNIKGYMFASPQNESLKEDFVELKQFGSECEIDEIYAPEMLDAFEIANIPKYLSAWISLLKVGGKLVIGGTDIYLLSKASISRSLSIEDINKVLFKKPFFIRSIVSIQYIRSILLQLDMDVIDISVEYSTSTYTIEAQKLNV